LASHFACDLGKGTAVPSQNEKRFRVIALTDNVPLMTAWANDNSYEDIFAEQLLNLMVAGDQVFAISGSGNSCNVLRALKAAKASGLSTIGLTGFQGGRMKSLCDHCIVIPSDNMQVIEDFHLSVAHALFTIVRRQIAATTDVTPWLASGIPGSSRRSGSPNGSGQEVIVQHQDFTHSKR